LKNNKPIYYFESYDIHKYVSLHFIVANEKIITKFAKRMGIRDLVSNND